MGVDHISQRELFFKYQGQTSPAPPGLQISKAQGCFIFDPEGKKYIDLISGIAVSALGHQHPHVIKAITDQVNKHLHVMVYGEFIQSPQVKLAEKISQLLGSRTWSTYFVNSGSEATEGAMKLAKRYTGRTGFIAFNNAYHGSTQGALSLMGGEYFKTRFRPLLPDITHLPFNDISALNQITEHTAAVFVEPVQGEAGVISGDPDYLKALRDRCTETGTLLVVDEIQSGLARTGKWFAFQHYDIIPDIVLMAKGLGGGMPLGAFSAAPEVMHTLSADPVLGHLTTFGGHPVSCSAALAVIEVIETEGLLSQVHKKAEWFKKAFKEQKLVKEFRSAGLMMALTPASHISATGLATACLDAGLITDWFVFNDQSIRIAPPLVIDKTVAEEAVGIILKALEQLNNPE